MDFVPSGNPLAPYSRATVYGAPLAARLMLACVAEPNTGCWLWLLKPDDCGYGRFQLKRRSVHAHRVAYQVLVGDIPAGLEIDHLCRVRSCVNPDHMELVTPLENKLRAIPHNRTVTHCKHGHALSGANLYMSPGSGKRACRACARAASIRYYARRLRRGAAS